MRSFVFVLLLASIVLAAGNPNNAKFECLRAALGLQTNTLADELQTRGSYDISNVLTMYTNLPAEIQAKVSACNLTIAPAMARCEAAYPGRCEQISPVAIQVKCDSRFRRVGCCHCAMICPDAAWREDEYHCIKPQYTKQPAYINEVSCGAGCEEVAGRWMKTCQTGYKRFGLNTCMPICPLGWHDEGMRCRKPANYRLTQPFIWTNGDN